MAQQDVCLVDKSNENYFTAWFTRNISDYRFLEELDERLEFEHKHESYCRRHAIMNALGFIKQKCHSCKGKPAGQYFKDVLEEDPYNINALRNLIHLYDFMGYKDEACKYRRQYDRILQFDIKHQKRIYARSLFEHAVCMTTREESFHYRHHKTMGDTFAQAIELGSECGVDQLELDMWKFALGVHYVRNDTVTAQFDSENSPWLKLALQMLYELGTCEVDYSSALDTGKVAKHIIDAHADSIGKTWCFMGTVLMRRYPKRTLKLSQFVENIDSKYDDFDGLKCLEKAITIAPHTPVILRRIGQAYSKIDDLMDEGRRYLEKAIDAEPVSYAYSVLGQWFLRKYEKKKNQNDLSDAIRNFEIAVKKHCSMFALFHYLAKAYEYNNEIEKVINIYQLCENTHEGPRNAEMYELWATLLEKNKCLSAAEEKRRLAVDTRLGRNPKQMKDFGVVYADKDDGDVTRFVETLEMKLNVHGFYLKRDIIAGENVVEELANMALKCRVIILFISENFDDECRWQLSNIIKSRKDCIVPMIVGKGELPHSVSHLRTIAYDIGSKGFWSDLEAVFHKDSRAGVSGLVLCNVNNMGSVENIINSPLTRYCVSLGFFYFFYDSSRF